MNIDINELKTEEMFVKPEEMLPADPAKHLLPSIRFCVCDPSGEVEYGKCVLRIGRNARVKYGGNIGYAIEREHRGHGYAAKACRLLFPIAKKLGMEFLTITCGVDNAASQATAKNAGAQYAGRLTVPEWHDMYSRGIREVEVFRVEL